MTAPFDPRPLRPYQQDEFEFLRDNPRSALWTEAGCGKTRPLLKAAVGRRLVIAPAAIRDTRVWQKEADRLDIEPPRVISFQEAAKVAPNYRLDTLIIDEAHHLKENKTTWYGPIYDLAQRTERVHESTGTPTPNNAHELWGQLRLIRPRDRLMDHYWPWAQEWFAPAPTKYSSYARGNRLEGCYHYDDEMGQSETCVHYQAFYDANMAGYTIRHLREDVMRDLPPLDGHLDPQWCPMTPTQQKAYNQLKKDMLALIPEEGITLEALSSAEQFQMLHQLSSGLGVLDPSADPKDRHSGKLNYLREMLDRRDRPILIVCWFKNSAAAIARLCTQLQIGYALFGSNTSPTARGRIVDEFAAGTIPVLIASLGVVKEGVDGLQYGSDEVVMFERYWVPGDNEQTIRRLHRFGQTRPVTARQLVTPKSVDSGQWTATRKKQINIKRVLLPAEVASLMDAA